jgi:hypothetical protein
VRQKGHRRVVIYTTLIGLVAALLFCVFLLLCTWDKTVINGEYGEFIIAQCISIPVFTILASLTGEAFWHANECEFIETLHTHQFGRPVAKAKVRVRKDSSA